VTTTPFRTIGALLEAHRQRAPDKAALVDLESGLSINFTELASTVDAIGRQLQQRGVAHGARVALVGNNGIDKLLLWLGIWRVGGVVCPLDLSFIKPAVAQAVLGIVKPTLVLVPHGAGALPFEDAHASLVHYGAWRGPDADGLLRLAPDRDGAPLPAATNPGFDDVASICCTSGTSSGMPKLVVYDHACYWYNGLDTIATLGLGPGDRVLEYRSFDWYSAQILSLVPFLQTGLTLCIAPRFSRSRFVSWLEGQRISICAGVPAVLNILLEAPVELGAATARGLRAMTCSSAPLSRLQWERFEQRYGIQVANMYGSSEAGWMCGNRPQDRRLGTVGVPVPHVAFRIVDGDGQDCAPGDAGQVVVDGVKLALGLLREDGSMTPIRGAPFAMRDAAVRDPDGFVQVLGRMDDLIIRGGVKIAPLEIEDVLLAHPAVAEVVALGVPDPIYGQEPACFVVPHADSALDPAVLVPGLLAYCRQQLPHEKSPKYLQSVAALPRNSRGKVMRDALLKEWWTARHS
jgi:acyl-CoA synthetase (AMP-forming)/AMP-acid ligase II